MDERGNFNLKIHIILVASDTKHFDMYLGLLYVLEDLAVYGYMTNTRIKFVLMVPSTDSIIKDQEMKSVNNMHQAYFNLIPAIS